MPEQPNDLNRYLEFKKIDNDPLRKTTLSRHLHNLGAASPEASNLDVELIRNSYDMPESMRRHHGLGHMEDMSQPDASAELLELAGDEFTQEQVEAILAISGFFHDIVYKHVDAVDSAGTRAWSREVKDLIGDFAKYSTTTIDGTTTYTTRLTEQGTEDPTAQMVAHIFDVDQNGITNQAGGNEFDSALTAAKWLESKGADERFIVAVTTAIAATIPFRPAIETDANGEITDGHMGKIADRLSSLNYQLGGQNYQPNWNEINAIMPIATTIANRDISSFVIDDSFSDIIRGGRNVKAEELAELRQKGTSTIRLLARAAGIERSAPLLYQGFAGKREVVPAANVFHFYIQRDETGDRQPNKCYPPIEAYNLATQNVEKSSELAALFFKSHEVGIVMTACAATLMGRPDAPVPGIVDMTCWPKESTPTNENLQTLTPDERKVYEELMFGKNQSTVNIITPSRSPISGYIFGTVGRNGVEQLSEQIKQIRDEAKTRQDLDPFCQQQTARVFLQAIVDSIGPTAFETIMDYLDSVNRRHQNHPDPQISNPAFAHQIKSLRQEFTKVN